MTMHEAIMVLEGATEFVDADPSIPFETLQEEAARVLVDNGSAPLEHAAIIQRIKARRAQK